MIKTKDYSKDYFDRDVYELEHGDTIICQGIKATIKEIKFQEYWEGYGFITEFTDTNGNYRSWKQGIDGGKVIPKED